ncbi:MAG: hypothetical protein KBF37_02370 [Saprospiraceae bacterium]|jgi:hypothetical protein|nr:hypothetical protein [Saprospiraceae bacterium]MBP9209143.1 hypothetical protein [Saprospiraceae bacterium]
MKKQLCFLLLVVNSCWLGAQAPQGFNYQGVARNASGDPIRNQLISLRLSMLSDSPTGTVVYSETHQTTTGDLGIFSLHVGTGTPAAGTFSSIGWGAHTLWLEVELDATGGTNYQSLGTSQILSVPYALHAATVSDNDDADADPANELQTLSRSGNTITMSHNGGAVTDSVNDADADPANELQTLSRSGNTITLSHNGGAITDSVNDADADPANEIQQLSLNGSTLKLSQANEVDLSPLKSPWVAVPGGIEYNNGIAFTDSLISRKLVWTGSPQPPYLSIEPGTAFIAPSPSNTSFWQGTLLRFDGTDPVSHNAVLSIDSLEYFRAGTGLLFSSRSVLDPSKLRFEFGSALTELTTGSLYHDIGSYNALYTGVGMIARQALTPDDVFERIELLPDSLTMYNDVKWKNVWVGTEARHKNGGLRLFSGANDRLIAHLGASTGTNDPLPFPRLSLFGNSDASSATLGVSNVDGYLTLFGSGGFNSAQNGVFAAGTFDTLPGPGGTTLFLYNDRLLAGNQPGGNSGYLQINTAFQTAVAGMESNNNSLGRIYANGEFRIKDPIHHAFTHAFTPDGFILQDMGNQLAGGLLLDPAVPHASLLTINGSSGAPNFFAGANLFSGSGDHGLAEVYDSNGIGRAGMMVTLSNNGILYANNGTIDVQEDSKLAAQLGRWALLHINPDNQLQFSSAIGPLGLTPNTGAVILNGDNSYANVYAGNNFLSNDNDAANRGFVSVNDPLGDRKAGMYVDDNNQGVLYADIKNFCVDHPSDPEKQIWYASLEGPEAAAYVRGTSALHAGEAFVPYPDHFREIALSDEATIQLTPRSAETYGLAVVDQNEQGFRVRELKGGIGNFAFYWEVKAVRKGYESYEVIRNKPSQPGVPPVSLDKLNTPKNLTGNHRVRPVRNEKN